MSDLYDAAYWQEMDAGAGTQDSVMWQDLAFIAHHVFAHDGDRDLAGEIRHVDVGCGMGFMVGHMRRRGFESFGLDISEYALASASEDVRGHLHRFDLTWVDDSFFGRERFELVTCFETLEHIDARLAFRAINHIYNLLVPHGRALLNICVAGQPGADRDPTHVNVVPRGWWESLLDGSGLVRVPEQEQELRRFHLFAGYRGTFVVVKHPSSRRWKIDSDQGGS